MQAQMLEQLNPKPATFVFSHDLKQAHPVDQETAAFLNENTNVFTLTATATVNVTNKDHVYNIAGTAGDKRYSPYKSWIDWYVHYAGGGPYNCTCANKSCNNPIYGGHMYINSYNTKNKWYILPLCNWHNNTARTGANYGFPVTQGPRKAVELAPKATILLREFFETKARISSAQTPDPFVDITQLPSFESYQRYARGALRPLSLVDTTGVDSPVYTVNLVNQSASTYYFVFTRKKPTHAGQSDVTLAWEVEKVAPYGTVSFPFYESYSVCCHDKKTLSSNNYAGGHSYTCELGSHFEFFEDDDGVVRINKATPNAAVFETQIHMTNNTSVPQTLGVGINGVAIGYQTDSIPNLTQPFKVEANIYGYVSQKEVRIGDVITNQDTGSLVSAIDFKNQMTETGEITWTLSADNVLSYSYPTV